MAQTSNRVIRVTIAYDRVDLRVVGRKQVAMKALPSNSLEPVQDRSGFWFQVEDAGGRVLYRRIMASPIRLDAETPSGDPDRPLRRVPLANVSGTFFILVPKLPRARTVRVFSSPLEPEERMLPAAEILRFPLHPLPG